MKNAKIELPDELHQDFKIKCIKEKRSMKQVIVELITKWTK